MDKKPKKSKGENANSLSELIAKKLISTVSSKFFVKDETKEKAEKYKKKFSPKNMAKSLTKGKSLSESIASKILGGEKKVTKVDGVKPKVSATKIPSVISPETEIEEKVKDNNPLVLNKVDKGLLEVKKGDSATDVISKLFFLLQKQYDKKDIQFELNNDFEKSKKMESDRRHKELVKAILASRSGGATTAAPEKEEGLLDRIGGLAGGAMAALGAGSLLKGVKGGASRVGRGAGKLGKSATRVGSKALRGAKGVLKFLNKIPGLSLIAAGAGLIMDVKQAIDDHEAGKISEKDMKKVVAGAVGSAFGGVGGAELGGLIGGAAGSVVPGLGTLVGGAVGGVAGFFAGESLGKTIGEKLFDTFSNTDEKSIDSKLSNVSSKTATPAKQATAAAAPTPSAPATSKGSSSEASSPAKSAPTAVSGGGSSATPMSSASSLGERAVAATNQNIDSQMSSGGSSSPVVINSSTNKGVSADPPDIMTGNMSVRNDDMAFNRVLRMSARAV